MPVSPLIGAEELRHRLERLKVYDIRWSLADPERGRPAYRTGHIPGAVFVDLDQDLAAPPGEGRHPLPAPEELTRTLGRLGLSRADPVVVYDDAGGTVAARMWWMLFAIGHPETRLLDGGLDAWTGLGLPLERGEITPLPATYLEVAAYAGVVDHHGVAGRTLVDARAGERYRGEREPVDPKAGHIPGAINLPHLDNLDSSGRFLDSGDLATRFAALPDDVVVYCGSGVNACHLALAMVVAGRPLPDVYVGSFSDWSRRDLPVATGP